MIKLWFNENNQLIFGDDGKLVFCDECPCEESFLYENCAWSAEDFGTYLYESCAWNVSAISALYESCAWNETPE